MKISKELDIGEASHGKVRLAYSYSLEKLNESKNKCDESWMEWEKYSRYVLKYGPRFRNKNEIDEMIYFCHCERARQGYFMDFAFAIEYMRPFEKKFYMPRHSVLLSLTNDLQELYNGTLSGMSISMPPRAGKTELGKRFIAFMIGMKPDKSIFFVSHTDAMARKVYSEIIELIESRQYCWSDIFPDIKIIDRSAEDKFIDAGEKETYKSFYARGVDGNMSGILEASSLLYCDDLIRNSEEARNPDRVKIAVMKYLEDIRQRRTGEFVKELHIGTRWAINDVIGVLEQEHRDDIKWKFRRLPALRDDGESNFNYMINPLTKEHFEEQKRLMFIADGDDISFDMIFQQEPADREGIVFPASRLSYYDELPLNEAERVVATVDVAFGGSDNFSMPIGKIYGLEVYIDDLIYVNRERATKEKTISLASDKIIENNVTAVHVEANSGGDFWADMLRAELKKRGYRCNITDSRVPTNKSKGDRIMSALPEILGTDKDGYRLLFKKNPSDGDYRRALQDLYRYNNSSRYAGKQIDDFPDSLAALAKEYLSLLGNINTIVSVPRKIIGL
jgi:hypothetical protein